MVEPEPVVEKMIKAAALQARKDKKTGTAFLLQTLLSEIKAVGKNNGNRETTDQEALKVITRFKKGVVETIDILTKKTGYPNRIAELEEELALYESFLPKQLSEGELRTILMNWKDTNYVDTPTMSGYMSALKRCYDGLYDGKIASTILKEIL